MSRPRGNVVVDLASRDTYGTYYRLTCARCGAFLGQVGDRLLSDQAQELVDAQRELDVQGLLGVRVPPSARGRAHAARRRCG